MKEKCTGTCLIAVAFALACTGCASPTERESGAPAKQGTPGNHAADPVMAQDANDPLPVMTKETRDQTAGTTKEVRDSPKERIGNKGERMLLRGTRSYEEGAYKTAAKQFMAALDLGLEARSDQGKAHKYLAFIACASAREKTCRDEFRKALDADPAFELQLSEAGHPIWGPVFRRAKMDAIARDKGN
jgi:hypothetical protein